mgnify:CR=1 FL=1
MGHTLLGKIEVVKSYVLLKVLRKAAMILVTEELRD